MLDIQRNEDNTIEHSKARIVLEGIFRSLSTDFQKDDVYTTVQLMFTVMVQVVYKYVSLDVKKAFENVLFCKVLYFST